MLPQEFEAAIYAAVAGVVVGGMIKLFNKFIESNKGELETHIVLRKELREELDAAKDELHVIHTELDDWKTKYFDQVHNTNQLKLQVTSLSDELEECRKNADWRNVTMDPDFTR